MELSSDALDQDGFFDARYTCDSDNSSPELRWQGVPKECVELALLVEDPDHPRGPFSHWVVYHIPPTLQHLPAGIPSQDTLPNGIQQGINGLGKLGFYGPCPAPGDRAHRYFFRLFALNKTLDLPRKATRAQVLQTLEGTVLEEADLVGKYQRTLQKAG